MQILIKFEKNFGGPLAACWLHRTQTAEKGTWKSFSNAEIGPFTSLGIGTVKTRIGDSFPDQKRGVHNSSEIDEIQLFSGVN